MTEKDNGKKEKPNKGGNKEDSPTPEEKAATRETPPRP